jgi:hypothetical protein
MNALIKACIWQSLPKPYLGGMDLLAKLID